MNRRRFLTAASLLPLAPALSRAAAVPAGKVEHCIMLWLGGGMAQMDTFDPKPQMGDGKKVPGSYYPSIGTAVKDVTVCEHLARTAPLMDRVTVLRTVHHDVVDEHAAAVNRMHTGRPVSGTVLYPSLGSLFVHGRGRLNEKVPPYVLMGYPSPSRGPGFLGTKAGYLYLTDTESGPAGLTPPEGVSRERQARRLALLRKLRASAQSAGTPEGTADFEAAQEESFRLAGPEFMSVFDLKSERADLRESYGGEFGQRCLLARRLVQRGVRFIEVAHNMNFVNGTGWDTHQKGQLNQHVLIRELDAALAALITDLEQQQLLEKTLIVVSSEFGRPPEFDSGGGRGHQPACFSVVLAGGGLRHRGAWGQSDDLAKTIVSDPVNVPGLFATILASAGIAADKVLHDGDRPVPVTDYGQPVAALLG
jgi:Protein of unknown function (DUF1501)